MFKINPVFKDYIWGGNKLKQLYGKESDLEIVAESWELSTHKDGKCSVGSGTHQGMKLNEYIAKYGQDAIGTKLSSTQELPILIKLIDAKDNLSVQVHPDDNYARTHENDLGKTEMWVVLEAEEDAKLVYGFNQDVSKDEIGQIIAENRLEEVLNYVKVQKGDVFFIEPGTVHAIGKGIVIAEIQESSNVTYRIYDYGRVGTDGKPRMLHVDKALEVMNLKKNESNKLEYNIEDHKDYTRGKIVECEYFTVEQIDIKEKVQLETTKESFQVILLLDGEVRIQSKTEDLVVKKGECVFIPACTGTYELVGKGNILLTYI